MPGAEVQSQESSQVAQQQNVNVQAGETPATNNVEHQFEGSEEGGFKTVDDALGEIKRLRKENAERRTKGKALEERLNAMEGTFGKMKEAMGISDGELSPEEIVSQLQDQNAALTLKLGIQQAAIDYGIPSEMQKYFQFLLAEKLEQLGEGEELSQEAFDEVLMGVRAVSAPKTNATAFI